MLSNKKKSIKASNLSSSTNLKLTNQYTCASCKKDTSININDAFCDESFDASPGKPFEEVRKVFQLIESMLKLMDESSAIV